MPEALSVFHGLPRHPNWRRYCENSKTNGKCNTLQFRMCVHNIFFRTTFFCACVHGLLLIFHQLAYVCYFHLYASELYVSSSFNYTVFSLRNVTFAHSSGTIKCTNKKKYEQNLRFEMRRAVESDDDMEIKTKSMHNHLVATNKIRQSMEI